MGEWTGSDNRWMTGRFRAAIESADAVRPSRVPGSFAELAVPVADDSLPEP